MAGGSREESGKGKCFSINDALRTTSLVSRLTMLNSFYLERRKSQDERCAEGSQARKEGHYPGGEKQCRSRRACEEAAQARC